jgi:hypothetical protein
MWRFEPLERDKGLPTSAHRVELTGSPRSLIWPGICPNCGQPASERITVRKIFRRSLKYIAGRALRVAPWTFVIGRVDVPFCGACAERHREQAKPLTGAALMFSYLRSPSLIAFAGAAGFAIVLFRPLVLEARGSSSYPIGLAVLGFLVLTAAASALSAWRETRFWRVPPQTDITRACDFSDDLRYLFLLERRVYAIRNAAFAEALAAANRDRLWTEARRKRAEPLEIVIVVVAILSAVGLTVLL